MSDGTPPRRLRRSRARGARLPPGCVCVDRSTPWANSFVVGVDGDTRECVRLHRALLAGFVCLSAKVSVEAQQKARTHAIAHMHDLIGHDLACFCRLDHPCHAETLLELASLLAERQAAAEGRMSEQAKDVQRPASTP